MIKVICVGKLKEKYLADAVMEYSKRISKYSNIAGCLTLDVKTGELVRRNLFTLPIGVSRETMTAIVNRLEKKGFVVAEIEDNKIVYKCKVL